MGTPDPIPIPFLADLGANLIVADIDLDNAARVAEEMTGKRIRGILFHVDVRMTDSVASHAETDAERERILQENPNRTVGSKLPHRFDRGLRESRVEKMCCTTFSSAEDLQWVDEEIIAVFD